MLQDINPREWGAFIVSIIVLGFFAYLLWFSTTHGLPKDDASVQQIVGALIAALSGVLGYWIGSSKSSQAKDATNADQARALAHFAGPDKPASGPPPAAALLIASFILAAAVLGRPGAAHAQGIFQNNNLQPAILAAVVAASAASGGGTITTTCTVSGSVTETIGGGGSVLVVRRVRARHVRYVRQ